MGVRIIRLCSAPSFFGLPKISLFFVDVVVVVVYLLRLPLADKNWLCQISPSLSGNGVTSAAKGLSFKMKLPTSHQQPNTLLTPPLARKASRIPWQRCVCRSIEAEIGASRSLGCWEVGS